jgi:putative tricarboxylic transport membrane protein
VYFKQQRGPREHVELSRAPIKGTGRVLLIVAAAVLHLVLVQPAGFVIASAALFWLTARAFDDRHPLRDGLAAIAVSVSSYLLFTRVLDVSLPAGVLSRWI